MERREDVRRWIERGGWWVSQRLWDQVCHDFTLLLKRKKQFESSFYLYCNHPYKRLTASPFTSIPLSLLPINHPLSTHSLTIVIHIFILSFETVFVFNLEWQFTNIPLGRQTWIPTNSVTDKLKYPVLESFYSGPFTCKERVAEDISFILFVGCKRWGDGEGEKEKEKKNCS